LIAFEHEQRQLLSEIANRPLQQRRLAGAGRTDEIESQDFPPSEPGPIPRGQGVILGEDTGFEFDDAARLARGRPMTRPVLPIIVAILADVILSVATVMMIVVIVTMAGMSTDMMMVMARVQDARRLTLAIERGHRRFTAATAPSAHQPASASSMVFTISSSPWRQWSLREPHAQAA
jgi:hypothetical protein